ncbi:MAG: hypothetical protein BMS9Abin11_0127 [Gammaproteobacteria bacterium]|nr:MAG: hypothetical protein BMS9Abin11_0127 [Gammaproteobacteria bacterium]
MKKIRVFATSLLVIMSIVVVTTASAERSFNPFQKSTFKKKNTRKAVSNRPSARLSVQFKALMPVHSFGKIWAGSRVNIFFEIRNSGNAPSTSAASYTVKCLVLSGTRQCPVADTTGPLIPNIRAGGSKRIAIFGTQLAKPGKYSVLISTNPGTTGKPAMKEFMVVNKRALRRSPKIRRR